MPSPTVLINGQSSTNGYDCLPGASITIAPASMSGINSWYINCFGTDDLQTAAAINASVSYTSINGINHSATFTMPSTARGSTLLFQSIVNNGIDFNGIVQPSYTTTFGVFALLSVRLLATNQTIEGSSKFGWITEINKILASALPRINWTGAHLIVNPGFSTVGNLVTTNAVRTTLLTKFYGYSVRTITTTASSDALDVLQKDFAVIIGPTTTTSIDGYFDITMPTPTAGRVVAIINASPNSVKVLPYASENINFSSSYIIPNIIIGRNMLVSNGIDWFLTQSQVI